MRAHIVVSCILLTACLATPNSDEASVTSNDTANTSQPTTSSTNPATMTMTMTTITDGTADPTGMTDPTGSSSGSSTTDATDTTGTTIAPMPVCGDGTPEMGEECDDGNTDDNDGCSTQCKIEKCGDSVMQTDEECDDGNNDSTDACVSCKSAFCGDEFVRTEIEQCDGNPDANASDVPCDKTNCTKKGLLVFVSSGLTTGAISFPNKTGIAAADAICMELAKAGTLKGTGYALDGTAWPFKAWLSAGTDESAPVMRFPSLSVPAHEKLMYIRYDGALVAKDKPALLNSQAENLSSEIQLTEHGLMLPMGSEFRVWTNTDAKGAKVSPNNHCLTWTNAGDMEDTTAGQSINVDSTWTISESPLCKLPLHLYCFEQPPM